VEEPGIGLRELLQIAALDVLLVADPRFAMRSTSTSTGACRYTTRSGFGASTTTARTPVHRGRIRIVERHPREQPVLVEQIVRDAHGAEQSS